MGTVFEVVFFATPLVEDFRPGDAHELGGACVHFQSRGAARDHKIGERVVIGKIVFTHSASFAQEAGKHWRSHTRTIRAIDRVFTHIDLTQRAPIAARSRQA